MEIAVGDDMAVRREMWRLTNRLEERTVPFQIEDNGTFFKDLTPDLQCEGDVERSFERTMQRAVANYELVDDDRVFAPHFSVGWVVSRQDICPELTRTRADNGAGRQLGYTTNKPLADLPESLDKLQRGAYTVDRDQAHLRAESAAEIFGDILPVKIDYPDPLWVGAGMAGQAVNMVGMENLYRHMMDNPDSVHALFDFMATERCDFLDWLQAEELLTPNNGEVCVGSGSCGYTDELPRTERAPGDPLTCADLWGFQEAQEATGISPEMYGEFIYPYQKRVSARFGLLYYGGCEPVHDLWPIIRGLGNVRKVTMSPWCDQAAISHAVGRDVVLSRKPHPMMLCGGDFDARAFRDHIDETLKSASGSFVELIFRDTCTLDGSMKERVVEACGIVRELIGRR